MRARVYPSIGGGKRKKKKRYAGRRERDCDNLNLKGQKSLNSATRTGIDNSPFDLRSRKWTERGRDLRRDDARGYQSQGT